MEHTNKIAKEILDKEFGDYHYNSWNYDTEYKMIIEAINKALSITAVNQRSELLFCGHCLSESKHKEFENGDLQCLNCDGIAKL